MKKYYYFICIWFGCTSLCELTHAKTCESRTKIQESIASSAADMVKKTNDTLIHCAHVLKDGKNKSHDIASILECIAEVQKTMLDILQELLESGSNDRWALASRTNLVHTRTVLQDTVQQLDNKKDDVQWWQQLCPKINQALPIFSKQTKE